MSKCTQRLRALLAGIEVERKAGEPGELWSSSRWQLATRWGIGGIKKYTGHLEIALGGWNGTDGSRVTFAFGLGRS